MQLCGQGKLQQLRVEKIGSSIAVCLLISFLICISVEGIELQLQAGKELLLTRAERSKLWEPSKPEPWQKSQRATPHSTLFCPLQKSG